MSWSINVIGTPKALRKALRQNVAKLSGDCQEEFIAALPHLDGLVAQNLNRSCEPVLQLDAYGSASKDSSGDPSYSQVSVSLKPISGNLV